MLPIRDINPTHRTPIVTGLLIAANVAVFVLFNLQLGQTALQCFQLQWGAIPFELMGSAPIPTGAIRGPACVTEALSERQELLTVFTSMFLHGGLFHLAFNMLFLWIFGNNVEDRLGHVRFLVFYLVGGVASVYGFALMNSEVIAPLIGASGAVATVLGGYLLMYPQARIHTYVPFPLYLLAGIIPGARITGWFLFFAIVIMPAWLVLGFWFVTEWFAVQEAARTGIANEAHVAGFLAGMLLAVVLGATGNGSRSRMT